MSVFKSQFTRALLVIPTANTNIPYPNAIVSGLSVNVNAYTLSCNSIDFTLYDIKEGDIIYNNTDFLATTVAAVGDAHNISTVDDIFSSADDLSFTIYSSNDFSGFKNPGCYLVSDRDTYVTLVTLGGDNIGINLIKGINCGLQVVKVISAVGDPSIIALW